MIRFSSISSVHLNLPPKTKSNIFGFKNSKSKPNRKFGNDSVGFGRFVRFVGFLHTPNFSYLSSHFLLSLALSLSYFS